MDAHGSTQGPGAGVQASEDNFERLIEVGPDGVVVVDVAGRVLYRNQAAAEMLPSIEVDGFFGFPIATGETTELDLFRPNGEPLVIEMRVMQTTWMEEPAHLATLRDVTTTKRSEDALVEERQRLDRVIVGSADAIVFVSPDGEIMEWNPAAERMFGVPKQQALGGRMDELLVETEGIEALARGQRGEVVKKVVQRRRRDGSSFKAEITSSAVYDAFGSISGYVSVIRDVTEQVLIEAATKAMASELEPTQAVTSFSRILGEVFPFCQLSLTVIEGDHYRRVVSISDGGHPHLKAGELVPLEGNSTGDAVMSRAPVINADTAAPRWPHDEILSAAGVRSYVILPLTQDDKVFATFNIGFSEPDVPSPKMVSTLQALGTAVSAGVKNILAYEKERETVQRLEELDSLKNEFLAMVSHDLRNPLAVIGGFADTLAAMWSKLKDEQKLQMIDAMKRNAMSLAKRVEQDLDVALIESGKFSFRTRTFEIASAVRSVVDDALRSYPGREIHLRIEDDLGQAIADIERTSQVLTNLISNAVKYSPDDAPVTVEVQRDEGGVLISVTDRGDGIPAEQQTNLFRKLSRLEGSKERVKGTGLGLYISKALIEGMGGRIWCESIVGQGSTFRFTLPALSAPGPRQ